MGKEIQLLPLLPGWFIALVALGLFVLLSFGCAMLVRRQVPRMWVTVLGVLRVAIIVVFVICLLRPTMVYNRTIEQRPPMLVLVDVSQSMQRNEWFSTAMSALDDATKSEQHGKQYDLRWYAFGKTTRRVESGELADLKPEDMDTRLAESIEAAWLADAASSGASGGVGGEPPRILLVSDGNDLGRGDAIATARRFGASVDVLLPPEETASAAARARIVNAQVPPRVLVGAEMRIGVTIRRDANGPEQLSLQLSEQDRQIAEQSVVFEPSQYEARVWVAHRPKQPGVHRYALKFADRDVEPYVLNVRVTDEQHEVLLLEDQWRWSFKFFRRILEDDPSFHLTSMLSRGPNANVQFGEPTRRVNLGGFPQGPAEIDWFDILVLGDVDVSRWPTDLAGAIADGVSRRGKSLIIIAGPGLVDLAGHPLLGPLLPVQISEASASPIDGPIQLRVASEAQASSLFSTSPDSPLPPRATALPPVDYVYPVLHKKPAATVLLEAVEHANAHGKLIAMAEQPVGRGRVLLLATDTLWKWQLDGPVDDQQQTLHSRFWQQALRALAPARDASGQSAVWVAADHSRAVVGQMVTINVSVDTPTADTQLRATVTRPDGQRVVLPLQAGSQNQSIGHVGSLYLGSAGAHHVLAEAVRDGQTVASGVITIEASPGQIETVEAPANIASLTALAQATGGRLLDAGNPDQWTDPQHVAQPRVFQESVTVDLWHNYTLVLLLCVLLGADWMLRLARGYV